MVPIWVGAENETTDDSSNTRTENQSLMECQSYEEQETFNGEKALLRSTVLLSHTRLL